MSGIGQTISDELRNSLTPEDADRIDNGEALILELLSGEEREQVAAAVFVGTVKSKTLNGRNVGATLVYAISDRGWERVLGIKNRTLEEIRKVT